MSHRFIAFDVALEFANRIRPVLDSLRRKNRALEDQLRRAVASVVLNISEGDGKSSLRDQARFFEIARGSCREARAALRLAALWGYADDATVAALDALGDRVCALLSRLIARASSASR
ncbi:MAG: four helix bundle protein [Deltaproteobacteria bacterium]|nr:four helix bundle protein [Deltaproteobacteria bacterium]